MAPLPSATPTPETTKVGVVQDALAEHIKEAPDVAGTKAVVAVGWPGGNQPDELVMIEGEVEDWTQTWATSGQAGLAAVDETFTLTVLVYVRRGVAGTYTEVRNRVVELIAAVQHAVRTDHTLDGAAALVVVGGGKSGRWVEGVEAKGRSIAVEIPIACTTYLTPTAG